jgi:transposase-like protein
MESHEVITQAIDKNSNVKEVAAKLGVSSSLVYKWASGEDYKGEGATNPLDRVQQLYEITRDDRLIQWLCQKSGGVFVRNPPTKCVKGFEVVPATQEIVQRFADVLSAISKAASDAHISTQEADQIRNEWDDLKRYAEGFVRCCEEGDFNGLQPSTGSK